MGFCNCSMFYCSFLYVHSSIAIIFMGNRELVALLSLSSWCLVMVERFFLAVPLGCLRFVIVVFPDHTHYFGLDDVHIEGNLSHLKCMLHKNREEEWEGRRIRGGNRRRGRWRGGGDALGHDATFSWSRALTQPPR